MKFRSRFSFELFCSLHRAVKEKEWIFSGIGVTGLICIYYLFFSNKKSSFLKEKIKKVSQTQKSGSNSTNIQIGGDVNLGKQDKSSSNDENNSTQIQVAGDLNLSGLSYRDVKEICIDVYRQNALILSQEAQDKIYNRVIQFISEFLKIAENKKIHPDIFSDPSFQYSLYGAQVSYGKTGDENIKLNLISALIEKAQTQGVTTKNIIIDEVLNVLPKLTTEHVDFLSFVYILFPRNHYRTTIDESLIKIDDIFSWP